MAEQRNCSGIHGARIFMAIEDLGCRTIFQDAVVRRILNHVNHDRKASAAQLSQGMADVVVGSCGEGVARYGRAE